MSEKTLPVMGGPLDGTKRAVPRGTRLYWLMSDHRLVANSAELDVQDYKNAIGVYSPELQTVGRSQREILFYRGRITRPGGE